MLYKRFMLFALITFCTYRTVEPVGLSSLVDIFGYINRAYTIYTRIKKELDDGKSIVDATVDAFQSDQRRQQKAIEQLAAKLDELSNEVLHFQDAAEKKLNHLDALLTRLPNVLQQIQLKNKIHSLITFINEQQRKFVEFTNKNNHFNNITLTDFSRSVVNPSSGIESQLDKLFSITVPSSRVPIGDTVLGGLNSAPETEEDDCSEAYYSQLSLFDLYDLLITTELVGLAVITYGYGLESVFYNTTVETEIQTAQKHVRERVIGYHNAFTDTMTAVPRTVPQCQPVKTHIRDDTYIELTDLFQAVITNDWGLMKEMSCHGSCEDIDVKKENVCVLGENQWCLFAYKACRGRMHNCITLTTTKICLSNDRAKRYEWFTDENGKLYGHQNHSCLYNHPQERTWWRWNLYRCEQCACVCDNTDEDTKAPQIVSLLETRSDSDKNKVITGLRFKREKVYGHSHVLHIEIKEGTLHGNGYIDETSEKWLHAEGLKKSVKKMADVLSKKHSLQSYVSGDHFVQITRKNNAIHLDNVVPESGRCITGIKFVLNGNGIAISVESAAFDYGTGKLMRGSFSWTKPSAAKRTELQLNDVDNPILNSQPNVQDSTANQFVRFTNSSFKKDAAQSTVPFLDARSVEIKPSVPIGGVGLFHKGADGYGGFLALKIFSIDYDKLLKDGAVSGPETNKV